jgi:hypothetical protein
MEFRVAHGLDVRVAAERVRAAIRRLDLAPSAEEAAGESELGGRATKDTPLGSVRARWSSEAGAILVRVEEKPPFLSDETVRRLISERLESELAS